jgi:hypothetical protein
VSDGDDRRRRPWRGGPDEGEGWLSLSDDELLHRIASLPANHAKDEELLRIVCSDRHFFVRQEAAKRIVDVAHLKNHSQDRHIGQILVRSMNREEDVAYLENLMAETRYLEVRKAAAAQLRAIAESRRQD